VLHVCGWGEGDCVNASKKLIEAENATRVLDLSEVTLADDDGAMFAGSFRAQRYQNLESAPLLFVGGLTATGEECYVAIQGHKFVRSRLAVGHPLTGHPRSANK
jgi:hypothetical protein